MRRKRVIFLCVGVSLLVAIILVIVCNSRWPNSADIGRKALSRKEKKTAAQEKNKLAQEATIKEVVGKVERMRGDDHWSSVRAGDRVQPEDSLRTDATGKADLEMGQSARLTVSEDTEVKVETLDSEVHGITLQYGRVTADYSSDVNRVVRIGDKIRAIEVETREGRFHVLNTGSTFGVATEKGTVRLESAASVTEVNQGELAVAKQGQAPSPAIPIPAKVLLKLAEASRKVRDPCGIIEGVAYPGAEISVGSAVVGADVDGRFYLDRSLNSGSKKDQIIRIQSRDLMGGVHTRTVVCQQKRNSADESKIRSMKIRWQDSE